PRLDPVAASRLLENLAAEIRKVRIDFTQHSESYYFQEEDPDLSLARQLPYALALHDTAAASAVPELQISAAQLSKALEQLTAKLDDEFLGAGGDLNNVLAAYAQDHGRTPRS
ncbi:two pore domain potassium channel family protein, partial [Arthrobacter deserti]|nr:two pore domain potassium channel family protein [Arthrobacter deserti]